MQEPIASAKTPSGRRRARLLAGTLALTMAAFGTAAVIAVAPASADVNPTNTYTIGTPGSAFTAVSATPSAAVSRVSQAYVLTMTAPSAIPDGDSITVTDSTAGNSVVASATQVSLVDDVAANCLQSGTDNGTIGAGGLVIILQSNCSIAAGDTVKIGLTVNDPTANFYFIVSSTVNGTTVDSNTVTINSVPPTFAAASATFGYTTVYTIAGLGTTPAATVAYPTTTITALSSGAGTTWTASVPSVAGLVVGEVVTLAGIAGFASDNPNGAQTITGFTVAPAATGFTFTAPTSGTGTYTGVGTVTGSTNYGPWSEANLAQSSATTAFPITSLLMTASQDATLPATPGPTNTVSWYNGTNGAGYTVTYTPPGGSLTTDPVSSVAITAPIASNPNQITLNLADGIVAGSSVTVTAEGLNPTSPGPITVTVLPEYTPAGTTTPVPDASSNNGAAAPATLYSSTETTGGVTFGTSVSGLTVTPSPTLSSVASTYTVGFKVASAVPASSTVAYSEALTGLTNPATTTWDATVASTTGLAVGEVVDLSGITGFTTNNPNGAQTITAVTSLTAFTFTATASGGGTWGGAGTVSSLPTGYICLAEPDTNFSSSSLEALVTDTTSGSQYVDSGVRNVTCGTATANVNSVEIPVIDAISAGDQIVVTVTNVTNPSTVATYSDFAVSTSVDSEAIDAPAYQIGVSSSVGVTVAVSPTTPGALATYTISGLHASGGLSGGNQITISVNQTNGTVLPDSSADYALTDSTTTTGSGGLDLYTYNSDSSVTLVVPNAINENDMLTITIDDVINPPLSGSYSLAIVNPDLAGPAITAPVFPDGTATLPDGGIIQYAGTDYLFAGQHAFGIPSPTVLAGLQAVDKVTLLTAASGATVPNTAPAVGTLVVVYNNPTIYVVGTDGALHGFATIAQFLGDGYDGADVITVPNIGGLTVGATAGSEGTAVTALATMSNGAIVDSSGTYYVFAGGKAFGIPTPTKLAAIQLADTATPLSGTITSTQTGATPRQGTVVTLNSAVWVTSGVALYGFKAMAQLQKDGYGGTPSIVIPNVGGLSAVTTYTGS